MDNYHWILNRCAMWDVDYKVDLMIKILLTSNFWSFYQVDFYLAVN